MKINFFKKEKHFKKENSSFSIDFYWKTAVCFMFLTILISSFFGYYLFRQTNKEPLTTTGKDTEQAYIIKKERIDKALEYFSLREKKSNQILSSSLPIVDPSL